MVWSLRKPNFETFSNRMESEFECWVFEPPLHSFTFQMLEASRELHKYFHDCKDVLGRIMEKSHSMSDELGRDAGSVSALQRKHQNFIQDLQGLHSQVQAIQAESAKLQVHVLPVY